MKREVIPAEFNVTVGSVWNKDDLTVIVLLVIKDGPIDRYVVVQHSEQGHPATYQWILASFVDMKKIGHIYALQPTEIQRKILSNVEMLWIPDKSKHKRFMINYTPNCEQWEMVRVDSYGNPMSPKEVHTWYNSDFRAAQPVAKSTKQEEPTVSHKEPTNLFVVYEEGEGHQRYITIGMVTREFALSQRCLDDQGFDGADNIPEGFTEVSESTYEFNRDTYASLQEAKQALLDAGFEEITSQELYSYGEPPTDDDEELRGIAEEVLEDVVATTCDDEADIILEALRNAYNDGYDDGYDKGSSSSVTTTTSTTPSAETLDPTLSGEGTGKPLLEITPDSVWRSGSVRIRVTKVIKDPVYGCDRVEGVRLDKDALDSLIRWPACYLCTFVRE